MKKTAVSLVSLLIATTGLYAKTQDSAQVNALRTDTVYIPERAILLHGDAKNADRDVMAVFYSRENLEFSDPDAPRFLFLDRQGKIAFGIGGQLYATGSYDFDGAIESSGFSTFDIPVPANPAQRSRLGGDLSHSSLFLKLVGRSSRLGMFQVYFQANFTGDAGGYGFKLKQAYATLGHVTVGLTNSTFTDGPTKAPTIDSEGPSGQVTGKNVLVRYATPSYKGFSAALSAELPQKTCTLSDQTEALSARVPDIPAYVQYSWKPGQHVRLSGIFRDMAYRDLKTERNNLVPGYGVQLSTITNLDPYGIFQFFGHIAYGRGIGKYINDLSGNGYDLVYSTTKGKLEAPEMMGWTAGLYVNVTKKLFFTGSFSRAQVFELEHLGGDSYHYGQYVDVNGFYNFDANFRVGAEYLHGWRQNYDNMIDSANRFNLLLQYSF